MKAISLWQPWASLMARDIKRVETRSWNTSHRGPLLIHASAKWTRELATLARSAPFAELLDGMGVLWRGGARGRVATCTLPFGALVGVADLLRTYPTDSVKRRHDPRDETLPTFPGVPADHLLAVSHTEWRLGDYAPGRWAWLTCNARWFRAPIHYRGHQGLFEVPDALVADALAAAGRGWPGPGK